MAPLARPVANPPIAAPMAAPPTAVCSAVVQPASVNAAAAAIIIFLIHASMRFGGTLPVRT
jgi:hypothetical protein